MERAVLVAPVLEVVVSAGAPVGDGDDSSWAVAVAAAAVARHEEKNEVVAQEADHRPHKGAFQEAHLLELQIRG